MHRVIEFIGRWIVIFLHSLNFKSHCCDDIKLSFNDSRPNCFYLGLGNAFNHSCEPDVQ